MTAPVEAPATLSAPLVDFLLELAIGVQRFGMYPPGHPALESLGERLVQRIERHIASEGTLQIAAANRQLLVGDGESDPGHPILRELARKFRDRGVGAVSFRSGVSQEGLERLLLALAADPRGDSSLPDVQCDSISLHGIGFDSLDLAASVGVPGPDRMADLWMGLARAALGTGELDQADVLDVDGLARRIGQGATGSHQDQLVMGYMTQLARVLKANPGEEGTKVRSQFSVLLSNLDDGTLNSLLEQAGPAGLEFAVDVCEALDPVAAVRLLELAPRQGNQRLGDQMLRLLRKLATQSDRSWEPLKSASDQAFKDAIGRISEDWDLRDPTPEDYSKLLDGMVTNTAIQGDRKARDRLGSDRRIVYTAIETDSMGATVCEAVDRLSYGEGLTFLLKLMETVPDDHSVGEYIKTVIHSPDQIERLTMGATVDEATLDRLIARTGDDAARPLLSGLMASESRSVRRVLSDRLTRMGAVAGAEAVDALEKETLWYRIRNLLILAREAADYPAGFDPLVYMTHDDERVRREALPLCLQLPQARSAALTIGLADSDSRVVRLALAELQRSTPPELVDPLLALLKRDARLGASVAKALGTCDSHLGLKALLDICQSKGWTGRIRLARGTPVMIASLEALIERWSEVADVRQVVELARVSKNPRIRAAVGGPNGSR